MNRFKPILAASLLPPSVEHTDDNILAAMSKLKYPVLATLKKDGIRALRLNGSLLSRTLKPIPNKSIRERSLILPGGFDMELWNPKLSYDRVESIVMSKEHKDSDLIQFHVLDWWNDKGLPATYEHRIMNAYHFSLTLPNVICEFPSACYSAEELFEHFLRFENNNGEGICFRHPMSPYKFGRSTLREQYLVKLSRYLRTELTIIGFKEQMENTNSELYNDLGLMKRQSLQDNLIGKDTLGALQCKYRIDDRHWETVDVGTGVGLTDKLRKEIWNNRDKYIGKVIVVKHKPIGAKNVLRHPIYCGFRNEIDI